MSRKVTSGQDDSITSTIGACAGRGTGTTWAIIGWFRATDNAGGSDFADIYFEHENTDDDYLNIQLKTSGVINFFYRPGGFGQPTIDFTTAGSYDDDVWHWLFFVCRADNDFEAFIDGTSVGSSTTSVTNSVTPDLVSVNKNINQSLPVDSQFAHWINFKTSLSIGEAFAMAYGQWVRHPNMYWELGIGSPEPDWSGEGNAGTVNGGMVLGDNPPIGPWFGIDRIWQGEKEAVERLEKWFQQTYPTRHIPAVVTY